MTIFCANDPCETEAKFYYVTSKGARFYLCYTCLEAFQLGQANADKYVYGIDDDPDDEDNLILADYDEEELFSTCQICGVAEESVQPCAGYGDRPLCSKCAAMHDNGEEDEDGD